MRFFSIPNTGRSGCAARWGLQRSGRVDSIHIERDEVAVAGIEDIEGVGDSYAEALTAAGTESEIGRWINDAKPLPLPRLVSHEREGIS
jgi:hypothetical protein